MTRGSIVMTDNLLPLERWFQVQSSNGNCFPHGDIKYFDRYKGIKDYLAKEVYPFIGAATSAEDQGVYTDHGPKHFDAVIRYAGKLLGLPVKTSGNDKICIEPYEAFVLLVSILLHDAGNIYGRSGHEKRPLNIYKDMGSSLCPDVFEAKIIAHIAAAHGGEVKLSDGSYSKDTISNESLYDNEPIHDIPVRQRFIAALVRFSDEICEDRSRAARFMLKEELLPKHSQVFHAYAHSISSVGVDHESKSISLKIELTKDHVTKQYGKGSKSSIEEVFLIDEIFSRLEKMYRELLYCRRFMYEYIYLQYIRATIKIYDDDDEGEMDLLKEETFELKEEGYPSITESLLANHPEWKGCMLKKEMDSREKRTLKKWILKKWNLIKSNQYG